MTCPALLLSLRWPPEEDLRYFNSTQKNDWTVFITFLFPFILFSLWFASTYFTIINHPFRLPRAGAHWFTSCCSLGWSEKHKSWKMQKVGVDSKSRHSTDFRKFFEIMIGIFVLRDFEQTCITYLPFITRENQQNWNMAKIAAKSNSWNLSRREHIWGMFEL